ncbi:MAG: hypothetical protein ACI9FJ_002507 [Alteromonadaceae bacterium]|jgi:hypothetical protein
MQNVQDNSRLTTLTSDNIDSDLVIASLKQDQVVLVKGLNSDQADSLMKSVCTTLDLAQSLETQATYASSLGHRDNVGEYYMSVNKRDDYQYIAIHSEGSSFINMQLASFYCYENTTDGGETILMNVNPEGEIWDKLQEQVRRGKSARPLTPAEVRQIKVMARLNMPEDTLKEDDEILKQSEVAPGFTVYNALAKPQKSHSVLLDREVYAYWDSVGCIDHDCANEFEDFLRAHDLLKLPDHVIDTATLDDSAVRRIKHYGKKYEQLFKDNIIYKMQPGDFVIINNLTWAHGVNNWTPESGVRKVAAAFA